MPEPEHAADSQHQPSSADGEYLLHRKFLAGTPVEKIDLNVAPSGGFAVLREWATNLFKEQGGRAVSPEIGEVILDGQSVRDSIAHGGANPYKRAAFAAVKKVIEKGRLIHTHAEHGKASYFIAAPVSISGTNNIVVVLAHRRKDNNRMYLHSVGTKESLLPNGVSSNSREASPSSNSSGDIVKILRAIFAVKPKDAKISPNQNNEPVTPAR